MIVRIVMLCAFIVAGSLFVMISAGASRNAKRKRDYGEKPKRMPRYELADDGELVEMDADSLEWDDQPKRKYHGK